MALDDDQEAALRGELNAARRELGDVQKALKDANKESQGHRLNADRANEAANAAKAALDAATAEAAAKLDATRAELSAKEQAAIQAGAEAKVAADNRVIQSEVRTAAVLAGMKDPDLVKLLDLSDVKLGDDGKIVIPADKMSKAKEARPYLFGTAPAVTSNPQSPPDPNGGKAPVMYRDMSPEQQASFKKQQGIR